MKQHPILYIYLTRTAGAEGAEVPKKGPEIRTHGIRRLCRQYKTCKLTLASGRWRDLQSNHKATKHQSSLKHIPADMTLTSKINTVD